MPDVLPKDETEKQVTTDSTKRIALNVPISLDHADIPILACCLVSGLCDSSVYATWSCFVSMQTGMWYCVSAGHSSYLTCRATGNTIFLALGASNQPYNRPYGWLKSMISILFFIIGCFTVSQTRHVGPLLRRTLGMSFLVQSLCIFIAAALVQSKVVPDSFITSQAEVDFKELIPLALLAFQSGGQMMTSRLMGFNEVPTTVLTSVYCDLISDPKILAPVKENVKRNRRFLAIVAILVGGVCGGWLTRSRASMSAALWISGLIKLVISIAYSVWKADQ